MGIRIGDSPLVLRRPPSAIVVMPEPIRIVPYSMMWMKPSGSGPGNPVHLIHKYFDKVGRTLCGGPDAIGMIIMKRMSDS